MTQEVKEIRVTGSYNLREVEEYISIKLNKPLNRKEITEDSAKIIEEYEKNGYLWVQVMPELINLRDGVGVEFKINEGKRAEIGEVRIVDKECSVATSVATKEYSRDFFTELKMKFQIDSLLRWYENNGFPFASVRPEDFRVEERKVSYTLRVDRGPKVMVEGVEFSGNSNSDRNALRRAVGLPKKFLYSEDLIKEKVEKLRGYEIFVIKGYRVFKGDNGYILEIDTDELKGSEIWGSLSYLPSSEFSGSFYLHFKNILGTLRRARISYERWARNLNFGLDYLEPLHTFFLGVNLEHITYDTLYSRTSCFGSAELPKRIFKLKGELGWERTIPYSQIYWVGSGGSIETMDYPLNPKRGLYGNLLARFGKRGSFEEIRSLFDYGMIIPLYKNLNFFSGFHFRDIYTQQSLNTYDLFWLGGAESLRGYRERSFFSKRIGWLNSELRLLGKRESRIFIFWDMGFYRDKNYKTKTGYGLGMRVGSGIGVLEIDYGIATHTDPFKGKVHISLGGRF